MNKTRADRIRRVAESIDEDLSDFGSQFCAIADDDTLDEDAAKSEILCVIDNAISELKLWREAIKQ